ncbi:MAG: dienelactone hydrolase family protein [Chloroflexi bacterium]|nr:dienelactone hydrolase family protein [Chloroflexota bacterium]MCY4248476.1 dienelactone hydrolase family protein [Chloroflexota bacterium]
MKIIHWLLMFVLLAASLTSLADNSLDVVSEDIAVMSGEQAYQSYLAYPASEGIYPAVVLIHSFNGLQDGYRDMTDLFASEGFVVLAIGWQTFERSPADALVEQLLRDSIAFLGARDDVDPMRIGLTGFCAGGRYTMLLLPQIKEFGAGVAWYGFPNFGDPATATDVIDQLDSPMLIIHGTQDRPSPIADIYAYASALGDAGKDFELKVYANEPHGFMLEAGELQRDDVATDAYHEMVTYFRRKLA